MILFIIKQLTRSLFGIQTVTRDTDIANEFGYIQTVRWCQWHSIVKKLAIGKEKCRLYQMLE